MDDWLVDLLGGDAHRVGARLAYGPAPNAAERDWCRTNGELLLLDPTDDRPIVHLLGGLLMRVASDGDVLDSVDVFGGE